MINIQLKKYSQSAKEFKRIVATIPDDWTIIFNVGAIPLSFHQIKMPQPALAQIDFNATVEYPLKHGGQRYFPGGRSNLDEESP